MNAITTTEIERIGHGYFASAVALSNAEGTNDQALILAARQRHAAARIERHRLMTTLRGEFAESRGWILSRKPFSLDALRAGSARPRACCALDFPWIDHADYFLSPDGIPAAILSHSYATVVQCIACAKAEKLNIQVLRLSYYSPHGCTAFVLTRRDGGTA